MPRCGRPARRAVSRPVCADEKNPALSVDRKLFGTSTIGSHPVRSAPADAPHDPPRSADACRSAIGRPILLVRLPAAAGRHDLDSGRRQRWVRSVASTGARDHPLPCPAVPACFPRGLDPRRPWPLLSQAGHRHYHRSPWRAWELTARAPCRRYRSLHGDPLLPLKTALLTRRRRKLNRKDSHLPDRPSGIPHGPRSRLVPRR